MHDVNPANTPPADILNQARALARRLNNPVYLYQYSEGWGVTAKLTQIPQGALITLIHNRNDSEKWNTGGC